MSKKKDLKLFGKIILVTNCFFVSALLIAYLSPYISPEKVWMIAFFGLPVRIPTPSVVSVRHPVTGSSSFRLKKRVSIDRYHSCLRASIGLRFAACQAGYTAQTIQMRIPKLTPSTT